jgi:suppressor of ftsI
VVAGTRVDGGRPGTPGSAGGGDRFDLIELRAADDLEPSPAVPESLLPLDPPSEAEAVATRSFSLGGNEINDRTKDAGMMGRFVVVEPGERPPDRLPVDAPTHGHD